MNRRSFWLLIRTAFVVIALTLVFLLLTNSARVLVPTPVSPLTTSSQATIPAIPTFIPPTLSPTIVAYVSAPNAGPYSCAVASDVGPVQVATCTDCTYYPLDKVHSLPITYQPAVIDTELPGGGRLLPSAKRALTDLFTEAQKQGLFPVVTSAYRSYTEQQATFNNWVTQEMTSNISQDEAVRNAERYSARAGHSEHQLGTVADLNCESCVPFDDTDQKNLDLWKFLAENAHHFGFVVSYPNDIEGLTGYKSEPWHVRYIGVEFATELYNAGYLNGTGACALRLLASKQP